MKVMIEQGSAFVESLHPLVVSKSRVGGGREVDRQPTGLCSLTGDLQDPYEFTTWLILPVVICLSQRLSHACLSTGLNTVKLRMAH